ncbi:Predicted ATPase [Anaerostipes hadrus]|uniref:Predicted ATPase n=1 Tax=Anaerostipes hadrus TaxID=649756 RepID=A0A174NW46_ANAHA|nr:AAA family ATPase [Anaerostipes hadrus]CUP51057.1 Predicted ATPase [Anaerostipes hadrus]
MLKAFTFGNYKNFKDEITIDFENIRDYPFQKNCISDGIIREMLICGRNATGKTNFGKALLDIKDVLCGTFECPYDPFLLNADSDEKTASFEYRFQFGDTELCYEYLKEYRGLAYEKLEINGISIFECDFEKENYDFDHLNDIHAETANTEYYLEYVKSCDDIPGSRFPFLKWLFDHMAFEEHSILLKLADYVDGMIRITADNREFSLLSNEAEEQKFYQLLDKDHNLQVFEKFLNAMGIKCQLKLKRLLNRQRNLYFVYDRMIPFIDNASSGTLMLIELYYRILSSDENVSFLYLDGIDSFFHYETVEKMLFFLSLMYKESQIILTSHNTHLLSNKFMRPDCLFILSEKGSLTSFCNATQRELKEEHNLEKMYISGEFEKYE